MNKRIITLILALAAVCGGASAQPKSTKCPRPLKTSRDFAKMTAVDTTQMRVYYAFCPHKIEDATTRWLPSGGGSTLTRERVHPGWEPLDGKTRRTSGANMNGLTISLKMDN